MTAPQVEVSVGIFFIWIDTDSVITSPENWSSTNASDDPPLVSELTLGNLLVHQEHNNTEDDGLRQTTKLTNDNGACSVDSLDVNHSHSSDSLEKTAVTSCQSSHPIAVTSHTDASQPQRRLSHEEFLKTRRKSRESPSVAEGNVTQPSSRSSLRYSSTFSGVIETKPPADDDEAPKLRQNTHNRLKNVRRSATFSALLAAFEKPEVVHSEKKFESSNPAEALVQPESPRKDSTSSDARRWVYKIDNIRDF